MDDVKYTPEKGTNDAEGNLRYRAMYELCCFVGKDIESADLILAKLIRVVMMDVSCSQQKGRAGVQIPVRADMLDSQDAFRVCPSPSLRCLAAEPYKKSGTKKDRAGEQLFFAICISASPRRPRHLHICILLLLEVWLNGPIERSIATMSYQNGASNGSGYQPIESSMSNGGKFAF